MFHLESKMWAVDPANPRDEILIQTWEDHYSLEIWIFRNVEARAEGTYTHPILLTTEELEQLCEDILDDNLPVLEENPTLPPQPDPKILHQQDLVAVKHIQDLVEDNYVVYYGSLEF